MHRQSCSHVDLRSFALDDSSWTADEVIGRLELLRSQQRVPFYLYDADMLDGISVAGELRKVETCNVSSVAGDDFQYAIAQYHVLRSAATHPWRVRTAHEADIIVIPGIADMRTRCDTLASHEDIAAAVLKTAVWQERHRDHLYVSSSWTRFHWAENFTITRSFIQSVSPYELQLHDSLPPPPQTALDALIPHPYVDHGDRRLTKAWVENNNTSVAIGHDGHLRPHHGLASAPVVAGDNSGAVAVGRDVDFFFGGQTTTRIGPGRRHLGYYVRWALMDQWSVAPHNFTRTLLIETDNMFNATRMGGTHWPAVRRCGFLTLNVSFVKAKGFTKEVHPSWYAVDGDAGWSCVPKCTVEQRSGACHGRYAVDQQLARARFALCLRGDIPTSPRLYGVCLHLTSFTCAPQPHFQFCCA